MNCAIRRDMLPREARAAISSFLGQRNRKQMVSASEAIRYLRGRFPSLETSDRRLTDIVAGEAIILGLNVEFDGGGMRTLFDRWPQAAVRND
jgi:hypothetical protein